MKECYMICQNGKWEIKGWDIPEGIIASLRCIQKNNDFKLGIGPRLARKFDEIGFINRFSNSIFMYCCTKIFPHLDHAEFESLVLK